MNFVKRPCILKSLGILWLGLQFAIFLKGKKWSFVKNTYNNTGGKTSVRSLRKWMWELLKISIKGQILWLSELCRLWLEMPLSHMLWVLASAYFTSSFLLMYLECNKVMASQCLDSCHIHQNQDSWLLAPGSLLLALAQLCSDYWRHLGKRINREKNFPLCYCGFHFIFDLSVYSFTYSNVS